MQTDNTKPFVWDDSLVIEYANKFLTEKINGLIPGTIEDFKNTQRHLASHTSIEKEDRWFLRVAYPLDSEPLGLIGYYNGEYECRAFPNASYEWFSTEQEAKDRWASIAPKKVYCFTTKDHKKIFIGDTFYIAIANEDIREFEANDSDIDKWKFANSFSTRFAAQNWLVTNTPFMSIQDVMNRLNSYFHWPPEALDNLKHFYNEKFKSGE